jgi:hypothetical protein
LAGLGAICMFSGIGLAATPPALASGDVSGVAEALAMAGLSLLLHH